MNRAAAFLALGLGVLLSGCFASDRPTFAPASATQPLEAGRYALFEQYGDQDKPSEYMEVRRRADGAYDFINEKGATNPVSLHPIAGGLHVAQVNVAQEGSDKKGFGYALFEIGGREVRVHMVECDRQDKAKLIAAGVEVRGQYECYIDRVADPAAFFAGLKRSEPPSRMLRQ